MVGEEVGITDLVLTVRIQGDLGNDLVHHVRPYYGQFHLHSDLVQVLSLVPLHHVEDRGGCLTAIDDLQVFKPVHQNLVSIRVEIGLCSGRRNSIVVGEEHLGFFEDGLAYSLVDALCGL